MQSVTIGTNQAGQRLDKFLHKYLPNAGTGFLYKMLRKKNITLNGRKADGNEMLALNDTVSFFFSDETFAKFTGRETDDMQKSTKEDQRPKHDAGMLTEYKRAYETLSGVEILFENENIVILNKPAGILTQKAHPGDISLNEWLIGYLLQHNPGMSEELHTFKPSVCNRLDRNTSGIVLCGKSLPGSQYLSRCIKNRTIRKFYRTICVGCLCDTRKIEGYLIKNHAKNTVTITQTAGNAKADFIQTAYTPIQTNDNYSLLEVELITGKTHQIRAHLSAIGHPLVGDFKYGREDKNRNLKKEYGLEHHLLHAYRVVFPIENSNVGADLSGMEICAPYPKLFGTMQKQLGL